MLLEKMTTVVLTVGTSSCHAEQASDGGRQIVGSGLFTVRKAGEELTYEPGNARVVVTGVSASAFNHVDVNGDVQAFLWHDNLNAHEHTTTIRIAYRWAQSVAALRGDGGCAEGGVRAR